MVLFQSIYYSKYFNVFLFKKQKTLSVIERSIKRYTSNLVVGEVLDLCCVLLYCVTLQ